MDSESGSVPRHTGEEGARDCRGGRGAVGRVPTVGPERAGSRSRSAGPEQGVRAARSAAWDPERPGTGTSQERRGSSWEAQGPEYDINILQFVKPISPLDFIHDPTRAGGAGHANLTLPIRSGAAATSRLGEPGPRTSAPRPGVRSASAGTWLWGRTRGAPAGGAGGSVDAGNSGADRLWGDHRAWRGAGRAPHRRARTRQGAEWRGAGRGGDARAPSAASWAGSPPGRGGLACRVGPLLLARRRRLVPEMLPPAAAQPQLPGRARFPRGRA